MRENDVKDLIGKPFVDGGRGPEGYDCWGLCLEVFRRCGIGLPDYTLCCHDSDGFALQFREAVGVVGRRCDGDEIPEPAIVAIRFNHCLVNHVGVYIGCAKFLHTREKTGVVIENTDNPYWKHRIEGYYIPC